MLLLLQVVKTKHTLCNSLFWYAMFFKTGWSNWVTAVRSPTRAEICHWKIIRACSRANTASDLPGSEGSVCGDTPYEERSWPLTDTNLEFWNARRFTSTQPYSFMGWSLMKMSFSMLCIHRLWLHTLFTLRMMHAVLSRTKQLRCYSVFIHIHVLYVWICSTPSI
jgi:hypothetical protein